jgi:hypothetical protein
MSVAIARRGTRHGVCAGDGLNSTPRPIIGDIPFPLFISFPLFLFSNLNLNLNSFVGNFVLKLNVQFEHTSTGIILLIYLFYTM